MSDTKLLRVFGLFITLVLMTCAVIFAVSVENVHGATIIDVKPGVPVSLKVPDTDLLIEGCVAPDSLVTITDANTVVGTATSDSVGLFSRLLVSQTPTIHTIGTYFEDTDSRFSTPTSNLVALAPKTLTTLNVYPSPTVAHMPSSVETGQNITFQGYTCPNSSVKVVIDGNLTIAANSDSKGFWTATLNSLNFIEGFHSYTVSAKGTGFVTIDSSKYQFNVVASTKSDPVVEDEADISTPVFIITPEDGYRTNIRDVLVSGIGPANAQIELFVDGQLVGSVFSNAFGEWSMTLSILGAQQTLEARACNSYSCGDISNSVRVYFGSAGEGSESTLKKCDLKTSLTKYRFSRLAVTKGIDIDIRIEDGNTDSRYNLIVDWGDVVVDHQTLDGDSTRLHHTYDNEGHFNGSVSVQQADNDCKDVVYFSVQVVDEPIRSSWLWTLLSVFIFVTIYIFFRGKKNPHINNQT